MKNWITTAQGVNSTYSCIQQNSTSKEVLSGVQMPSSLRLISFLVHWEDPEHHNHKRVSKCIHTVRVLQWLTRVWTHFHLSYCGGETAAATESNSKKKWTQCMISSHSSGSASKFLLWCNTCREGESLDSLGIQADIALLTHLISVGSRSGFNYIATMIIIFVHQKLALGWWPL
jgi:hypothetical protein